MTRWRGLPAARSTAGDGDQVAPVAALAANPMASQPVRVLSDYYVDAEIDFDRGTVSAGETITYRNPTARALDAVTLTAVPLAFQALSLNDVAVDGVSVRPVVDGISIDVPLSRSLAPDESVRLDLAFSITVPRIPGRFGLYGGMMSLGNWLPVVAPYRQGRLITEGRREGYDHHRYVEAGDAFFTEVANFRVTVRYSPGLQLAHTGTVVDQSEGRRVIDAPLVRDFAISLSDRFEAIAGEVDGVILTSFFLPEHRVGGRLMLDAAMATVRWLNRFLSPYPYPALTLAEMGDGTSGTAVGQEYPNLVLASSAFVAQPGGMGSYLAYLVIHEVAHQWFYGLVGNDQVYEPWLDEAIVSWLTLEYYRQNEPELYSTIFEQRIGGLLGPIQGNPGAFPVDSSIYTYNDETTYFAAVYRRGVLFIEELAQTLGVGPFNDALRDYVQTFSYRLGTPAALMEKLQARTTTSLWPLFGRYLSYRQLQLPDPGLPMVSVPNTVTDGQITLRLAGAPNGLLQAEISIDDRPISTGSALPQMTVPVQVLAGEQRLVSVILSDEQGRSVETSRLVAAASA